MPITIAVLKEVQANETRVAAIPETVKKLTGMGIKVIITKDAGKESSYTNQSFKDAGAEIATSNINAVTLADIIFCIQTPDAKTCSGMKKWASVIGALSPFSFSKNMDTFKKAKISAIAMELMPRITRAQNMDILSSQSNLAGYQSVIEASNAFNRAFPMMMTAAGTIAPAKAFIMGVGVAGLQAIATAKRLGAAVSATDVRSATKEQVESLGAKFVMVEDDSDQNAETAGGYAKEMSDDYKKKQAELIAQTISKQDIVITTALIPGRPAPILITEEMVKTMKEGSVIVDLAAQMGGNCPLTEKDKIVVKHGVTIIGYSNLARHVATDASALFSRNLFNFINLVYDTDKKKIDFSKDTEITKAITLMDKGTAVHEILGGKPKAKAKALPKKKKAVTKKKAPAPKKPASKKKKASTKTKGTKK